MTIATVAFLYSLIMYIRCMLNTYKSDILSCPFQENYIEYIEEINNNKKGAYDILLYFKSTLKKLKRELQKDREPYAIHIQYVLSCPEELIYYPCLSGDEHVGV